VLLEWADEIVTMTSDQAQGVRALLEEEKPIVVLGIEDNFRYRDPELIKLIRESYDKHTKELSE